MTRQAATYRDRRVLLAGDAAHVHPPVGGQGLNIGVQDAVNLGWKLAQVVKRTSPESLLDTYHAERHPVGARVLRDTMAQIALSRPDDRTKALRDTMSELLGMDEPRKRIAAMMSGLDVHYDLGDGHPLLGRRMPDLDLVTADGPRASSRCCTTRGRCSSTSASPARFDIAPWADRVRLDRRELRRSVGASGARRGHGARGGVDSARRICRLGGRSSPGGARSSADHLVRTAGRGVAHRLRWPPQIRCFT